MELPAFTAFQPSSSSFPYPPISPLLSSECSFRRRRILNFRRSIFRRNMYSIRVMATAASNSRAIELRCDEFWGSSEFVEVVGIGSRNDAVFDFCMESPFHFPSLRFWNIMVTDSMEAQLQRRILGKDVAPIVFEAAMSSKLCDKAVILVASAGYGSELVIAIDILKTIRSANGFVVTIIVKPFSFEGQRRQDEAQNLMDKLQEHTNVLIALDTDTLLKKDLVTLDEAVKTANNAVLMAIAAVSVLTSDKHKKFIDASDYDMRMVEASEVMQVLERFKEAKIGFGAGYNIKTSILRSMYDCPFLSVGVKDLDGMVICIVASSGAIDDSDVQETLRTFRQTTEYEGEVLISAIHEPSLEPNLLVTTVFILGFAEKQVSQKSSILSGLALRFRFFFNLFSRNQSEKNDTQKGPSLQNALSGEIDSPLPGETGNIKAVDVKAEEFNNSSEEPPSGTKSNVNEFQNSSGGFEQAASEASALYDSITEDTQAFQRQPLVSWNLGHEHQIANYWGKEKGGDDEVILMLDNMSLFCLPVGVRSPEESKNHDTFSTQKLVKRNKDDAKVQPPTNLSMPSRSSNDTSLKAVKEFYNSASARVKGKDAENPKKRNLSARAASMLEAERDSPKQWSPTVEMQYRGGFYKGRCQGGLPEGKGCLVLADGSIYDGTWRYGKRSGMGTFYFSNGDAFQGSWRDDVIHGKGWLYFQTGDRWFANFWKGKANGESRFYSKSGDVFFGNFLDGWRHGQFICIDVDGTRFIEIWDEGVLVSRKLESDNGDD